MAFKLTLNLVFLINGILVILMGLWFMIFPSSLMTMIGFSDAADGPIAMRFVGIWIFGAGILAILMRNSVPSKAQKAVTIMLFTDYALETIFNFIFCDLTNIWMWTVIIFHITLTGLYGYFLFKKPSK